MNKRQKVKGRITTVLIVLAVAVAAVGIGLFVNILVIQSSWKNDRLELSEQFGYSKHGDCKISCGGTELPADAKILDYYFNIIIFPKSMAIDRKYIPPADDSILLTLADTVLTFTPTDDGHRTNLNWCLNGEEHNYTIGGTMDYIHLLRYFKNAASRAE